MKRKQNSWNLRKIRTKDEEIVEAGELLKEACQRVIINSRERETLEGERSEKEDSDEEKEFA